MSAYYVQRTFSDGVKGGIALGFAELVRPFIFGPNWTRLRIGINCAINDYGTGRAVTNIKMAMGVCCGVISYNHTSGTTTNYLGYHPWGANGIHPAGVMTYNANSGNPYHSYTNERGSYMTKVGTTITAVQLGSGGQPSICTAGGTVQRRCPFIFEVYRSTPLAYIAHTECGQSAGQMSIPLVSSEFLDILESSGAVTPPLYGALTQGVASAALATATPANGLYDHFNFSYAANNFDLEIYEMYAIRLN